MTDSVDNNPFAAPSNRDVGDVREVRSLKPIGWCGIAVIIGVGIAIMMIRESLQGTFPTMDMGIVGVAMTVLAVLLLCLIACRRLSRPQAVKLAALICIAMWIAFSAVIRIHIQRDFTKEAYLWIGGGAWLSVSLSLPLAWLLSGRNRAIESDANSGVTDDTAIHG